MALNSPDSRLKLPDRTHEKLRRFQKSVWLIKLGEGVLSAIFGLLVSYLIVFCLDRFFDTSAVLRTAILCIGAIGLGVWLPWMCHRWIWKSRRLDQVARLLKYKFPRLGDHLLGVIELVNNFDELQRSESLCRAALEQVDESIKDKKFENAVPSPRHRQWAIGTGSLVLLVVLVAVLVPLASSNAFARWLMPWRNIDRYTFTSIENLPSKIIVPLAEKTNLDAELTKDSRWKPESGVALVDGLPVTAENQQGTYSFELPPLEKTSEVHVRIGDVRKKIDVEPTPRPELVSLTAEIELPSYLKRDLPIEKDIRGGSVKLVHGSKLSISGSATRDLALATVNDNPIATHGKNLDTVATSFQTSSKLSIDWRDEYGLSPRAPMALNVSVEEDAKPTLVCKQLANQRVLMEKDTLSFEVLAEDDFGLKTIGMEWVGNTGIQNEQPLKGEKIVASGSPNSSELKALATFSPQLENIAPQQIQLRLYAEDYLPSRERIYSPTYTLFVLSEEEHAVWLTKKLDKWYKQALETYELEQTLFHENKRLRDLPADQLDRPENRRKIESQAAQERAQSRRLNALNQAGEKLAKEATRNDQFNVETLEKLSEMLSTLKGISEKRMPSVSDLLKKAAEAPGKSGSTSKPKSSQKPGDGKPNGKSGGSKSGSQPNKNSQKPGKGNPGKEKSKSAPGVKDDKSKGGSSRKSAPTDPKAKSPPKAPSISLKESSMDKAKEEKKSGQPSPPKPGKLTLPSVTLQDKSESKNQSRPAQKKMEAAVEDQEKLLAEFHKVSEELGKLVSDLEGSTFVKRLKGMARKELKVASDVNRASVENFGKPTGAISDAAQKRAELIAERQSGYQTLVKNIYNDLEAYSKRNKDGKFKTVLSEIKNEKISKQLQEVAKKIASNEPGSSKVQAELLADTFDRLAEQLVGPG